MTTVGVAFFGGIVSDNIFRSVTPGTHPPSLVNAQRISWMTAPTGGATNPPSLVDTQRISWFNNPTTGTHPPSLVDRA